MKKIFSVGAVILGLMTLTISCEEKKDGNLMPFSDDMIDSAKAAVPSMKMTRDSVQTSADSTMATKTKAMKDSTMQDTSKTDSVM